LTNFISNSDHVNKVIWIFYYVVVNPTTIWYHDCPCCVIMMVVYLKWLILGDPFQFPWALDLLLLMPLVTTFCHEVCKFPFEDRSAILWIKWHAIICIRNPDTLLKHSCCCIHLQTDILIKLDTIGHVQQRQNWKKKKWKKKQKQKEQK
jgi:hypothetical protein